MSPAAGIAHHSPQESAWWPVSGVPSINFKRARERRNLSVGQRAMLYAVAHPEPEKGGRGKKPFAERRVLTWERISLARAVLHEAPDLVASGRCSTPSPISRARKTRRAERPGINVR
jgi:hypothetical protein